MSFISNARRFGALPIVLVFLTVVVVTFSFVILPSALKPTVNVWIGSGMFKVKVADNDEDRLKGLSDLAELQSNQALLMVFPSDGKWKVWLKDMQMPVDVVWLDKNKKVVYIVKDAKPEDMMLEPKSNARYVLELPAGSTTEQAILLNKVAIFEVDESKVQ